MTQPAIPRWETPWLLPLSTQGFYRAGKSGGSYEGTKGSMKEPQAHPNSPHPADLKEPLLLLRADMSAGLARLGIQVLGSCLSPSLPSCYPLQASPYPQ